MGRKVISEADSDAAKPKEPAAEAPAVETEPERLERLRREDSSDEGRSES